MDEDDNVEITLPRYAVMQHRGEAARILALVQSKSTARKIVLQEARRYKKEDQYFVVLDGMVDDPGVAKVVGTCCHPRMELVVIEEGELPKLMPVEIARLFEHEDGVTFLTENRKGAT